MKIGKWKSIILKILLTVLVGFASLYAFLYVFILGAMYSLNWVIIGMAAVIVPLLFFVIWKKGKRKKIFLGWLIYVLVVIIAGSINYGIIEYKESLRIKTDVNINVYDYMPFEGNSKIAKLEDEASLKLTENPPKLDGAAATFPLYSAFVNAVYPRETKFREGAFTYNNTVEGYKMLAEKEIDIFFGAYPSEEQLEYAKQQGTEFEFTEIGKEGFVFFVNKNNEIESLTSEQIKDIYSGKITNWKDVGGENKKILAFQRNEGSGSQSMLIRFMNGIEIMEAERENVNNFMGGIINQVADYKNYDNSIGFSFRYYLESIIANPNVKMLAIDGIEPTKENISNGTYPITTSLYAVTYKGNTNENVQILLDWILSEEGQELVYKTGYAKVK